MRTAAPWGIFPKPNMRRTTFRRLAVLMLACGVSLFVLAGARAEESQKNPYEKTLSRLQNLAAQPLTDWKGHVDNMPHGEDPNLSEADWVPVPYDQKWGNGPIWLRRWVEIPRSIQNYSLEGSRIRFDLRLSIEGPSQMRIYFNGVLAEVADGETHQPILIGQNVQPGTKILIAINIPAATGPTRIRNAELILDHPAGRPDPSLILAEIKSAQAMIPAFAEGRAEREKQLDAAVRAIDFAALDRGDQQGFDNSLRSAQEKLQPIGEWAKQFSVRAVGQSHIDMAWLWPASETVEVVRNTYATVLQLMRQYPDFIYSQSSAQTFLWMEEKYPDLFKEIQQRVKEGRWELVGGMWVEPDLNMPTGESLVRQILLGKRYFEQRFGVDVRIGWNIDSFGYTWQLPQICKRSGLDYFVTSKLNWNDTTKFPYKLFWWESPDGSRVLTYFPHYVPTLIDPVRIARDVADYVPRTGYPENMHLYGVGDHGGGPTRTVLDGMVNWIAGPNTFPKLNFSTAQAFFEDIDRNKDRLKIPVWRDEMYLEFHRGVMTTQAEIKKQIRQSEELMLNAEKFSSLALLQGQSYPQEEFEENWQKVLFSQFHDLMPGSSIPVVYKEAARELKGVELSGNTILSNSLKTLTARINTEGPGIPVVVFNSLNWVRTEAAEAEAQFPAKVGDVQVRDARGAVVPSAVIARDDTTHTVKVRFLAKSVPAMGYKVFRFVAVPRAGAAGTTLKASATEMENEFVRVKVDPKTGCITSLVNKGPGLETLAPGACGNLLQAFVDKPKKFDAWNIDADFEDQKWDLKEAEEVALVEATPVRAVIRVKKRFQSSKFVQDICLYPGVSRVDVNMQADWREKHILLKVAFPVSVESQFATYEIPYGTIERPTTRNTPAEKAKFEVPALRWGDLSDARHGFSLLNASKYGYDAKGNVIRLSLLRSPTDPDPHADEGFHEFTYALYAHAGDWKAGETERRGYELNFPLLAVTTERHAGTLPAAASLVGLEAKNVILTAVKKAEDGDALIFRFFEFEGKAGVVRLRFPRAAEQAWQVNLMEKQAVPLALEAGGKETTVTVHPYEIVTLKASFGKSR